MLESMRKMTQGVTAKILMGLLVVSFAVWGASSSFISGGGTNTIVVGETKVSMTQYRFAYLSNLNMLSQRFGQRLTREQAQAFGVDRSVQGQLLLGALFQETARKMDLGISDDQLALAIRDDPAFQDPSGSYSRQRLLFQLREVGLGEDEYVRIKKASEVRQQIASATTDGLAIPQQFFDFIRAYGAEKRVFDFVKVTKEAVGPVPEPDPAQIDTYFGEHKDDYVAPEYRELVILRLTADDIAKPEDVTAEEVAEKYEETKTRYTTPEKRHVQQLTFPDSAAAEAAAKRLAEGELFDSILTEMGKTQADIDLGTLTKDQIPDQTIADAAFALAVNEPSGVVSGIFGPVILRVTTIEAESVKPLSEVEAEIRKSIAIEKAADQIFDMHDKIEDERAAGENLTEAARKVGLTARKIERVDRQGNGPDGQPVSDLPESGTLLSNAFDTDIGVEADPISIGTTGFVWYEVSDIVSERPKTLDEVRDEVVEAWKDQQMRDRIRDLAFQVRDRTEKGEPLAEVVAELLPADSNGNTASVITTAQMARSDSTEDFPGAAVKAGFAIPKDSVAAVAASETGYLVLRVAEVIAAEGNALSDAQKDQFNTSLAESVLTGLGVQLQEREDVVINQQAIDAAINY